MDGPREYHTSWISQTEENKHDILPLICEIKKIQMNIIQNRKGLPFIEKKIVVTKGEKEEGRDKLGVWD